MRRAKKREVVEAQGETLPHPRRLMRILGIKNRREDRREERNRERVPNPATPDHLVASYNPYGSYGGLILKPPARSTIHDVISIQIPQLFFQFIYFQGYTETIKMPRDTEKQ